MSINAKQCTFMLHIWSARRRLTCFKDEGTAVEEWQKISLWRELAQRDSPSTAFYRIRLIGWYLVVSLHFLSKKTIWKVESVYPPVWYLVLLWRTLNTSRLEVRAFTCVEFWCIFVPSSLIRNLPVNWRTPIIRGAPIHLNDLVV